MADTNNNTIVGNVTRDPELRYSQGGMAIANFGLAWNQNKRNGDDWESVPHFFDVTCFGQLAENVAESITKGMRLVCATRLDFSSWETDDGDKRSKVSLVAENVGVSLQFATVDGVTKTTKSNGGDQGPGPQPPAQEGEPF